MLCVGMPQWTLRVRFGRDAVRPRLHSHAERGNDLGQRVSVSLLMSAPGNNAEAVAR